MLEVIRKGVVYDKETALIAGVCRCTNGDLLVSFNTGGDLSAGERAGLVRSTDGGVTWSDPEVWFDSVFTAGGIEIGCSLTRLSTGRILFSYADGFYLQPGSDDYSRHALLVCPVSDDNGRTWTNEKAQCYAGLEAFAFGKIIEMPDHVLLLPIWGSYDEQGNWVTGLLRSTDGGVTWNDYSRITDNGDETPITRLPDGRLLALVRGYDKTLPERPLHVCHSADDGRTWSAPQRVNINGTSPSLHVASDGQLFAGFRSTQDGGNCHIASSADGGLSWTVELELELTAGKWHYGGYPVMEDLPDGPLFVTYHNADPTWHVAYNILRRS